MSGPNRPPIGPEPAARFVVETLQKAGHQALYAGGCVRDRLLGRTPNDYDVATSAEPSVVRGLFHRTLAVGEQFGIVIVRYKGEQIEVATFRADGDYSDGRRPDKVHYTEDPALDASRRDFTVNGLFYDPLADELHDFVGGREDIQRGLIRAIGDPVARFTEDRLRILRAPRFAAVLGFELEPETAAAAERQAPEIATSGVSAERIRVELKKLLVCPGRASGWRHLQDLGLLPIVWPAAASDPQTALAMATLPEGLDELGEGLPWALPLRTASPAAVSESLDSLRCSKKERDGAADLVEALGKARTYEELSVADRKRLLRAAHAPALLALVVADASARGEGPQLVERLRSDLADWQAVEGPAALDARPLIGGRDLQQAGLQPGPAFARILRAVADAQLEGRVSDTEQALALAREMSASDA
jgi:poly(A) polymerase